jgi:hypothetical protein
MMLFTDTVPFPNQDEIGPDEDGVGYALRMATVNGLTFNDLARRFASPGHLYLPADAASALAFMFGCSPTTLEEAFVRRYFRGELSGAAYLGHHFLRPYHVRQTRPQICPACIEQAIRAQAAWSISLVTCCPFHQLKLLDRCVCGRAVSWRRPSIDFCECGRRLTTTYQSACPADARELAVSSQIMYLLGPAHFRLRPPGQLPPAFDDISVDAFVRILWAFGIIESEQSADHPRSANRIFSTHDASALVCRALDRLMSVIANRSRSERLRVCYTALSALHDDCALPPDLQLVNVLIAQVGPRSQRQVKRIIDLMDRQLTLFGE